MTRLAAYRIASVAAAVVLLLALVLESQRVVSLALVALLGALLIDDEVTQ